MYQHEQLGRFHERVVNTQPKGRPDTTISNGVLFRHKVRAKSRYDEWEPARMSPPLAYAEIRLIRKLPSMFVDLHAPSIVLTVRLGISLNSHRSSLAWPELWRAGAGIERIERHGQGKPTHY